MPDLTISISEHTPSALSVEWTFENKTTRPYFVSLNVINQHAGKLRAALSALVQAAMQNQQAAMCESLLELAVHGAKLYRTMFQAVAVPGIDANQKLADQLKTYMEKRPPGTSIWFKAGTLMYVPWQFMYQGTPPATLTDPYQPSALDGLCCLRHRPATVFEPLALPLRFLSEYPAASFGVLPSGNAALVHSRASQLSTEEKGQFEHLTRVFGPYHPSTASLTQAWSSRASGLFYFFGHSKGGLLELSLAEQLDITEFRDHFQRKDVPADAPPCLVFLNGCETATQGTSEGFLNATAADGFCGFVGTESKVPSLFALRFGIAFQKLLYDGEPLDAIMHNLLHQHWPLSLLYSLYANSGIRLNPDPALQVPTAPPTNFSKPPLGIETLETGC